MLHLPAQAGGVVMTTWFPIVGAPTVWLLQVLALWLSAAWTCGPQAPFRGLVIGISVLALALAIAAFAAAGVGWRRTPAVDMPRMAGWTRPEFSAGAALLVSGATLIAVIATAFPTVWFSMCQPMR